MVATLQLPFWKPLLADNLSVKKHIYIYSPSGAVRDKAAFKRGIKRLITLGHEVEVDPDALLAISVLRVTMPPDWRQFTVPQRVGQMWH